MQYFIPGTIVAVAVGPVEHVGILAGQTPDGRLTVISNSRRAGGVVEEPIDSFAGGAKVRVLSYPGILAPAAVVWRARSRLGQRWNLFNWNCEHFVRWVHGLKPTSPQLWGGMTLLAIIAAGILLARSR